MSNVEQAGEYDVHDGQWRQVLLSDFGLTAMHPPLEADDTLNYTVFEAVAPKSAGAQELSDSRLRDLDDIEQGKANAVVWVLKQNGVTMPLEVVGDIAMQIHTLAGSGLLVARLNQKPSIEPLVNGLGPYPIGRGDHYSYANRGRGGAVLALLDVCRPAFNVNDEQPSGDPFIFQTLDQIGQSPRMIEMLNKN